MAEKSFPKASSEQAYQVIRTNFSYLLDNIQPDKIADDLFSDGLISDEDCAIATDDSKQLKVRARKIIFPVMSKVKSRYEHFETFCMALERANSLKTMKCAKKLKDDIEKLHKGQPKKFDFLKGLKEKLLVIQKRMLESDENLEAKYELIKEFITKFINDSLEVAHENEVSEQLNKLCYEEMLIPANLFEWTFKKLHDSCEQRKPISYNVSKAETPQEESTRSSFLLINEVKTCLLLCDVVSSYNYDNYFAYLKTQPHSFDEVSFSLVSPNDLEDKLVPYIMARDKTSQTMYVAFREPKVIDWIKGSSLNKSLDKHSNHIPIRFFVEQIQNGYTIVFTGFSFGGLLALSVYDSLWNENCLHPKTLKQCVYCITFGIPLIPLDKLEKSQPPLMKENHHFFMMKDDVFSRLLQCYKHPTDERGNEEDSIKFTTQLQNAVSSLLMDYSVTISSPKPKKKEEIDAVPEVNNHIAELMKIIVDKQQLSSLPEAKVYGTCQYLYPDTSSGSVTVSQLAPKAALSKLTVPCAEEVKSIPQPDTMITMHSLAKYKKCLLQVYPFHHEVNSPQKLFEDIPILKPNAKSIKFYRHGEEVALVLEGTNLWFCSHIKITGTGGTRIINTLDVSPTCHSINFNYTPKDKEDLLIKRKDEFVEVTLFSHFSKSIKKKLPAEKMFEYHLSQRQRQLAKCTPTELIKLSFLSALLERTPKSHDKPSDRYTTICNFLENAVRIVPIESICFAIAFESDANAWKCADAFTSTKIKINPSMHLTQALNAALSRLAFGIRPDELAKLQQEAMQGYMQKLASKEFLPSFFPTPLNVSIEFGEDNITCMAHAGPDVDGSGRLFSEVVQAKQDEVVSEVEYKRDMTLFRQHSHDSTAVLQKFTKLRDDCEDLCQDKLIKGDKPCFISNCNIQHVYPAVEAKDCRQLQTPMSVLKSGRKVLNDLQANIDEKILQRFVEGEESNTQYNEEMISTVNDIITNDLSICVCVLGAFMEEQITIPLVESPEATADKLQTVKPPTAVGVWALFGLPMIDFEKMIQERSMTVMVEKYIRNIFSIDKLDHTEEMYAGKLQFIMHSLANAVSFSTQYISYSFERQLAESCKDRKITTATTVNELVSKWNTFFKGNLMSHVIEPCRPLVARWILWCLSIYHLREELASHTTVGVVGLSKSGKSSLIKTLFKQKVTSGSANIQRTTVPFLYNLDGLVDGLSIIDFPGVDDRDKTVVDLSKLLLQLSQLIVLVVEYKRCHTESASEWIKILREAGVPVLVCLTHGDKLYADTCINDGKHCSIDQARRFLDKELQETLKTLDPLPNWTVALYSFCQDNDSTLNNDHGRQILKDVGILSCNDVGKWIVDELRSKMKEEKIADNLHQFILSGAAKTADKSKQTTSSSDDVPPIHNLDVYGENKFFITPQGIDYTWEGHGLKIQVPPGAISDDNCPIYVKVISTGHYELPEDAVLVSPLYWLYCPAMFQKEVHVTIQHCADPAAAKNNHLFFIHGKCNQDIPYTFKILKGSFSPNSQDGVISLKSFCLLGTILKKFAFYPSIEPPPSPTEPSNTPIHPIKVDSSNYFIKVFVKQIDSKVFKFDLIFIKDLPSFHTVSSHTYCILSLPIIIILHDRN
jgi:GTP-binding protein EngB required for normal cell division